MLVNDHRNFRGILQAAVCLCDRLALHIASCHFDHEGDATLLSM